MAATSELASLVSRLEAVTNKLEGIAAGSGGDDGTGEFILIYCNIYYSRVGLSAGRFISW